jgi:multisubunit Na+/H+ antiporter MnhG subunit
LALPLAIPWPQLAQAHGQIQTLGFVLVFIGAVGLQLFPRFLGAPVLNAERATWGAITISLALLVRLAAQPMAGGPLREAGLAADPPGP